MQARITTHPFSGFDGMACRQTIAVRLQVSAGLVAVRRVVSGLCRAVAAHVLAVPAGRSSRHWTKSCPRTCLCLRADASFRARTGAGFAVGAGRAALLAFALVACCVGGLVPACPVLLLRRWLGASCACVPVVI